MQYPNEVNEVTYIVTKRDLEKMHNLAKEGNMPRVIFSEDSKKMREEADKIKFENLHIISGILASILQK